MSLGCWADFWSDLSYGEEAGILEALGLLPAVTLPLPNRENCSQGALAWTKKRRCCAEMYNSEQSTWKAGTTRGMSLAEPFPKPLLRKWQVCRLGKWSSPYSWDWKPESSCRKKRQSRSLLCIHRHWLPAKNSQVHDNRLHWSAWYVNRWP